MRGEFQPALDYYNQALASATNDDEKRTSARAGIARVTIQLGDVRRGRQLALDCASAQLCRECAAILEGMNQMQVRGRAARFQTLSNLCPRRFEFLALVEQALLDTLSY